MADYAKISVKGVYSKSSDYSDPKVTFNPAAVALTPDEYIHAEMDVDSGSNVIDTGMFNWGVHMVSVKNNDSAISVSVHFKNLLNVATVLVVPPGGILVTPDFFYSGDLNLIAASGNIKCEVFIVGT